jgi:hypothetical protein
MPNGQKGVAVSPTDTAPANQEVVMDGIGIRRVLPGELDAACTVIGLAFAANPNTLTMAGGDRAKAQRIMQAAVRVAKLGRQ